MQFAEHWNLILYIKSQNKSLRDSLEKHSVKHLFYKKKLSPCSEVSSHQDFYWWVVSDQAQETAYPCLSKVSHPDI